MQNLEIADRNDTTPQCSLDSLTINDFMLSESEAGVQRAILYTAWYLVKGLGDLQVSSNPVPYLPCCEDSICSYESPVQTPRLSTFCSLLKDAELKGNNQVRISHSKVVTIIGIM